MIGFIIILSILLSFTMWFRFIQHTFTFPYSETDFDLIVKGFSEEQIPEIEHLPFIDSIYPVRLLTTEAGFNDRTTLITVYAADNFESIDASYFTDRLLITKNKQILMNQASNPIVIDRKIARELNAGIGDEILLLFGESRIEAPFTVVALSEHMTTQGLPAALILWQGEQRSLFLQSFGQDPMYSLMFIKANDKEIAKDYFIYEFIPLQMVEEGLLDIDDRNEINRYNRALTVDREEYLDELRYELKYTPPIVALTSMLGFIAYLLVLYREANKKLILHEKDFSILHGLGLPKVSFMVYIIFETVIIHTPLLAAAAFIVKYVVYDVLMQAYLPWYIFIWYCLGAYALQMMAAVFNGFIMYLKLRKTNIAAQLAKE